MVLGGDSPLGLPLILDLERKGYIVITSVSSPEAVDQIEGQGNGYVRALVLDPSEVRAVCLCVFLSLTRFTPARDNPVFPPFFILDSVAPVPDHCRWRSPREPCCSSIYPFHHILTHSSCSSPLTFSWPSGTPLSAAGLLRVPSGHTYHTSAGDSSPSTSLEDFFCAHEGSGLKPSW